jgi:5'-methylthioadenosine phosphorylase
MPEAALARELDLDYATIAVIANSAAGRAGSLHGIRLEQIEKVLQDSLARVRRIIEKLAAKK